MGEWAQGCLWSLFFVTTKLYEPCHGSEKVDLWSHERLEDVRDSGGEREERKNRGKK